MHKNTEINIDKIKFSFVSSKDLILSLDRLSRFKFPEVQFYRVFSDLLCRYLLFPKLTKEEIRTLDIDILKSIVEKIWNVSAARLAPGVEADLKYNIALYNELNEIYNLNADIKNLCNINLNLNAVITLLNKTNAMPINLKRLIIAENNYDELRLLREKYNLLFPVEKVVLCEGITEEILLPKFASLAGYNFYKNGIKLVSAGGKNQVEKLYCSMKDELNIPVFILLDADAVENSEHIRSVLRKRDRIFLIKKGEFEDTFSLNLIKRTINRRYKNICQACIADFKKPYPMTKILTEFFRINELGDFQKSDFAKELSLNLKYKTDLTLEIIEIVNSIKSL